MSPSAKKGESGRDLFLNPFHRQGVGPERGCDSQNERVRSTPVCWLVLFQAFGWAELEQGPTMVPKTSFSDNLPNALPVSSAVWEGPSREGPTHRSGALRAPGPACRLERHFENFLDVPLPFRSASLSPPGPLVSG